MRPPQVVDFQLTDLSGTVRSGLLSQRQADFTAILTEYDEELGRLSGRLEGTLTNPLSGADVVDFEAAFEAVLRRAF